MNEIFIDTPLTPLKRGEFVFILLNFRNFNDDPLIRILNNR